MVHVTGLRGALRRQLDLSPIVVRAKSSNGIRFRGCYARKTVPLDDGCSWKRQSQSSAFLGCLCREFVLSNSARRDAHTRYLDPAATSLLAIIGSF